MSGYTDLSKIENTRNCLRRIACHDELQFSKDSIVNVMEKFVKTVNVMDETILVPCRLMDRQVGDSTDIIPTPGKNVTSNQHSFSPNLNGKRNSAKSKNVHEFLNSSELFNLYNMLNALKNDLLWTGKDETEDYDEQQIVIESQENKTEQNISTTTTTQQQQQQQQQQQLSSLINNSTVKGHTRRPSTASMASIASVSQMSDSESDISQENDSGVESESNKNGCGSEDSTSSSEDGRLQNKKPNNVDKATELAKRCRRHLNGLYQCLEQMTEAANYLTARYQNDIGGSV